MSKQLRRRQARRCESGLGLEQIEPTLACHSGLFSTMRIALVSVSRACCTMLSAISTQGMRPLKEAEV